MICKELKVPINIENCQALLWRLPLNHQKIPIVDKDLKKRKAGYNGEATVYYHLSFLKDKKYKIFYDIRLPLFSNYFQIDFLILTPFYILIIEVKNISGIVTIDPFIRQLTRTYKGLSEGFSDPISQVQRQKLLLQKWFSVHKLKHPPIEHLVVFSNPSTILNFTKTPPADSPYRKIIHAQNIIDNIKDLNEIYVKEAMTDKEMNKMKKTILKKHEESELDFMETYSLTRSDIVTGVRCENCHHIPMIRVSGAWSCVKCGSSSRYAHLEAVRDYFLLLSDRITNRELRSFLHLNSRNTAYKILKTLQLETKGGTKSVTYSKPTR
ncbi:nuclease-related domain-containing protein [Rossellomorea sp. y25]|uniref:nuclease-related domain-containing protein n=1 Tax=Rossellomorea sp. y25 TaxID=3118174 RepID=UPI0026295F49|nr:nuclease-related domain-containing protein [uncultured Rossellomorea sp.]